MMEELRTFVLNHRWTVCCTAIGFVLSLLLLTIGFWRTLLLTVFVGCGYLLGRVLDRSGIKGVRELYDTFKEKLFTVKGNQQ